MTEPTTLGPNLEPPPGGLARLQRSVRQRTTRGVGPMYWIAAASVASLVTLSVFVWGRGTNQQRQIHRAVQQALTAPPQTHFKNAAYIELPSSNRNVRILLVGSLSSSH